MNQQDWDELKHEVRRELIMHTNPYSYPMVDPWSSASVADEVEKVATNIVEKFRIYAHKLEDEIHRKHHEVENGCLVKHRDGRVCGQSNEDHRCFPNG